MNVNVPRLGRIAASVVLFAAVGWGCRCPPTFEGGPCLRRADAVFVGRVIRTEPESWGAVLAQMLARVPPALAEKYETGWSSEQVREAASYLLRDEEWRGLSDRALEDRIQARYWRRNAVLRVTEAFSGIDADVEITLPIGLDSCSIPFDAGESWLVYASGDSKDGHTTRACTGTRLLEHAEEDLRYLRELKAGRVKARLFGFVTRERTDLALRSSASKPVSGVQVVVRFNARELRAVSDARGRYEIEGLDAGSYDVRADLPGGSVGRNVQLDAGACSVQNWLVTP